MAPVERARLFQSCSTLIITWGLVSETSILALRIENDESKLVLGALRFPTTQLSRSGTQGPVACKGGWEALCMKKFVIQNPETSIGLSCLFGKEELASFSYFKHRLNVRTGISLWTFPLLRLLTIATLRRIFYGLEMPVVRESYTPLDHLVVIDRRPGIRCPPTRATRKGIVHHSNL